MEECACLCYTVSRRSYETSIKMQGSKHRPGGLIVWSDLCQPSRKETPQIIKNTTILIYVLVKQPYL